MFFSKFYFSALFIGVFMLSGCSSPETIQRPVPDKKEIARLDERSGKLAEKIKGFSVRATVIDRETLQLADAALLTERLKKLGFNRVFFTLTPGDGLDEMLTGFIAQCSRSGIAVYGHIRQTDAVYKPSNNLFLRKFFDEPVTLASVTAEFAGQNRELPPEQQLKGFVLDMAPHLFTTSTPFRPSGCPYSWGRERFGKGLDNEQLMAFSHNEVENAARAVAPLPVMVQIPDFYHRLVKSGKLSAGTLLKFTGKGKVPRELVILNSGNKPSELFNRVKEELKDTPQNIPVLVAVNLAPHTAITKGELRRRNWNDLVRSISYAAGKFQSSRNFSGLVLAPCNRIELLLEEK